MYILFVDTEHQKQDAITHIAYSHTYAPRVVCGRSVTSVGRSHRSVGHIAHVLHRIRSIHSILVYHGTCILLTLCVQPVFYYRIAVLVLSIGFQPRMIRDFSCDPILGL